GGGAARGAAVQPALHRVRRQRGRHRGCRQHHDGPRARDRAPGRTGALGCGRVRTRAVVVTTAFSWTTAPAAEVASVGRSLLGWELRAGAVRLRLTELEAYEGPEDAASHAFRGRTPRNAVMYGPAGYAYVYFVFGMHWCLNIVCGGVGEPSAVLVRAGEIVAGEDVARDRRQWTGPSFELAPRP